METGLDNLSRQFNVSNCPDQLAHREYYLRLVLRQSHIDQIRIINVLPACAAHSLLVSRLPYFDFVCFQYWDAKSQWSPNFLALSKEASRIHLSVSPSLPSFDRFLAAVVCAKLGGIRNTHSLLHVSLLSVETPLPEYTLESILASPNEPIGPLSRSPLMLAIGAGNLEMIRLLLTLGADRNFKDIHGNTTLHWAVSSNNLEVVKLFYDPNVAETCTNLDGKTPLITAVSYNYFEVVNFMVQNGINAYNIVMDYFDAPNDGNERNVEELRSTYFSSKLHARMSTLNLDTNHESRNLMNFVGNSVSKEFGVGDNGKGSLKHDSKNNEEKQKGPKILDHIAYKSGDTLNHHPGCQSSNDCKTPEEDHSAEALLDPSAEATQNDSSTRLQDTSQVMGRCWTSVGGNGESLPHLVSLFFAGIGDYLAGYKTITSGEQQDLNSLTFATMPKNKVPQLHIAKLDKKSRVRCLVRKLGSVECEGYTKLALPTEFDGLRYSAACAYHGRSVWPELLPL
ncbi:hypothetical protein ACTXT7_004485 [Hymenolepis weldensis]